MKFLYKGFEISGFSRDQHDAIKRAIDFVVPEGSKRQLVTVSKKYDDSRVQGRFYPGYRTSRITLRDKESFTSMLSTLVHELVHFVQFERSGFTGFQPGLTLKIAPVRGCRLTKAGQKYLSNPVEMEAFHIQCKFVRTVLRQHPMQLSSRAWVQYRDYFNFDIETLELLDTTPTVTVTQEGKNYKVAW